MWPLRKAIMANTVYLDGLPSRYQPTQQRLNSVNFCHRSISFDVVEGYTPLSTSLQNLHYALFEKQRKQISPFVKVHHPTAFSQLWKYKKKPYSCFSFVLTNGTFYGVNVPMLQNGHSFSWT